MESSASEEIYEQSSYIMASELAPELSLDDQLMKVDEPFSSKLKAFAERSGRKSSDIYVSSNVAKKQYYKLLKDPFITPKKTTVLGLAVGLRLNIEQTKELLASAGYALSPSSGADIIVEHYIRNQNYDCIMINAALYDYGFEDKQIGTMA